MLRKSIQWEQGRGQTDATKPMVFFRNFTKVPKNESECIYCNVGTSF